MKALRVLVITAITAAFLVLVAPSAQGCGPGEQFFVAPELLAGDFNAPDSALNDDYRVWADNRGVEIESIEITGAYVYESVHWEESVDGLASGSVSVLVEVWGEWAQSREPRVVPMAEQSADCPHSQGVPQGQRWYSLVTSEGELNLGQADESMPVLTTAFGAPEVSPRDFDLEAQLIAQLQTVDTGSSLPLILGGVGLGALLLAGAFWKYTRRPGPATNETS